MNAATLIGLHSGSSVYRKALNGLAMEAPSLREPPSLFEFERISALRSRLRLAASVTSRALAPSRDRVQMLVRVTVPAPAPAATARFLVAAGKVSGIIIAVPHSHAPPPNPSFERTRKGRPRCTRSSFLALLSFKWIAGHEG